MAATRPSTTHRYAESLSSSDRSSPCSARRDSGKNLSLMRRFVANSSGRRTPSDVVAVPASPAADNSYRALVKARDAKGGLTFGSMVKKLMEKRPNSKPGSAGRAVLVVPPDPISEDLKKGAAKGSHLSALSRKLYQKGRSGERKAENALTDVKANTRTLAMVLRSERELLAQNKEYEAQISELRLLIEEKNREVEKLKDLCLRQREEIKVLKDAILFPDVMNSQLQELLEKQGFELKQAKQVIPSLQKQVTSLTGQLQCLAEDLAEVKADKYPTKICFDGQLSSPRTPTFNQEPANSLEYSSGDHMTSQFGSPDEMFLRDLNPCLTPCFPKSKPQDNNQLVYDSPKNESLFLYNTQLSPNTFCGSTGRTYSKSSENRQRLNLGSISAQKVCKSDENKLSIGKPRYHNLF